MHDEPDWSLTTFEGNRLRQQRELMALPFREKLRVLEHLSEVADLLARARTGEPGRSDESIQNRSFGSDEAEHQ